MQKSELIRRLSSASEDDVQIEIFGTLYEIDFGHAEATFDGFATVFPEALTLKPVDAEDALMEKPLI